MATTYSPNLRLSLIGTGEQQGTWGGITNTNLGTLLEEAIGGWVSVPVTDGADTVLSAIDGASDQSRNMVLNLTGVLTATRNVVISSTPPVPEKLYVVKNATNFAVTFKVSGQTGVSIPSGATYFVYVDGTDVRQINGSIAFQDASNVSITGGSIVTNASSLSIRDSDGSHIMSFAVGSNLTANRVFTLTAGDAARTLDISASNVTVTSAGASLVSGVDAAAQRSTLGLGTVATQNANAVSISGGSVTGITDLALADGGTGASLADPNANAVLGWNDTANVMRFFTAGTGISINATSNTISSTVTASGGLIRAPQVLTSNTSYTTPAGCNSIYVEAVGGGGGGGGCSSSAGAGNAVAGGGGGSGGYAAKLFPVAPLTAYTYAIGAGGTAGAKTPAAGGTGGNTTFTASGTTITASGGGGGGPSSNGNQPGIGGAGGAATNGDINITGSGGGGGTVIGTGATGTNYSSSGAGGSSYFGGGARPSTSGTIFGNNGTTGGGGSGMSERNNDFNAATGGAGGAGIIRIWEFT